MLGIRIFENFFLFKRSSPVLVFLPGSLHLKSSEAVAANLVTTFTPEISELMEILGIQNLGWNSVHLASHILCHWLLTSHSTEILRLYNSWLALSWYSRCQILQQPIWDMEVFLPVFILNKKNIKKIFAGPGNLRDKKCSSSRWWWDALVEIFGKL